MPSKAGPVATLWPKGNILCLHDEPGCRCAADFFRGPVDTHVMPKRQPDGDTRIHNGLVYSADGIKDD